MQHFTAFFFIILAAKSKNDFDTFDTSFRVIYNALFTQVSQVYIILIFILHRRILGRLYLLKLSYSHFRTCQAETNIVSFTTSGD